MSYHKFPNLRDIFQGDLKGKVMKNIVSKEYQDKKCNCNRATLDKDGLCQWKGHCGKHMVLYVMKCRFCPKEYLGQTQNALKERSGEHARDVKKLLNIEESSDSYAAHMVTHFPPGAKTTTSMARTMSTTSVLWQGKALSCMKSFGRNSCQLCMQERIALLKMKKEDQKKMMNSNWEMYGACPHKTSFHRFIRYPDLCFNCTDDGAMPEKVHSPGPANIFDHISNPEVVRNLSTGTYTEQLCDV